MPTAPTSLDASSPSVAVPGIGGPRFGALRVSAPALVRVLGALLLVAVVAAGAGVGWTLAGAVRAEPFLPQWDPARHGLDGLRLAEALRQGDLLGFAGEVMAMSTWPPVFPLLETPAFLVFGPDPTVPRLLSVVLFVLMVPAIFWTGRALGGEDGDAVGLVAAALVAASPFTRLFATLVMLEVPGALLLILALGAYARALGTGREGPWRAACILATALFFCKFNYGLMWLVPMALHEAWRVAGSWREVARRLRRAAADFRWRPWTVFLALYGGLLLVIFAWQQLTGEFALSFGAFEVRGTSLGNPVYALWVIVLLRGLWRMLREPRRSRAWLAGLEPRHREFVLWVGVPIALWMLLPSHARDFVGFVENRSSDLGLFSAANLVFYPRSLAGQYAPGEVLGWALLALAAVACLRLRRLDERGRVLVLALACAAVAIWIHPYKLPRFAFTLAPLVWLAAATQAAAGARGLLRRLGLGRGAGLAVLGLAGLTAALLARGGVDLERLRGERALRTVPASLGPVTDAITDLAIAEPGSVVVGTWNLVSPGLVEWQLHRRHPRLAAGHLPRDWRLVARDRGPAAALAADDVRRVIVLDLEEDAPAGLATDGYREETAAIAPVRALLAADPGWALDWDERFPATGFRVRGYRKVAR